jgi:polyhydroxyalkanoate synthase
MVYYNDFMKNTTQEMETFQKKLLKGYAHMIDMETIDIAPTPKELVYSEDSVKLYRYTPVVQEPHGIPLIISYALVNKQYMLDLHQKNSVIKTWIEQGLDIYIIDWGYPDYVDKFLTMEDYIDGYIDNIVDYVRERHQLDQVNLLGICQGATMATIYAALNPEKVNSLVTMVMPFDFNAEDGLLFKWSKELDIDSMIEAFNGIVPGSSMNYGFNMLKPLQLNVDKYIHFIDRMDDKEALEDFLRMEQWIYDSPNQAGPMLAKFVKDLYKENKLLKNELEVGGRKVDLSNITMPVLCVLAQKDHLVPPSSTRPFMDAIPSQDKTLLEYPVGHIGIFVSSRARKEVCPAVSDWVKSK